MVAVNPVARVPSAVPVIGALEGCGERGRRESNRPLNGKGTVP